ncbi:MAG: hypothetical protein ACYTHJ_14900 [Planctomycetota bacterium]|jgi:hypothetical protein
MNKNRPGRNRNRLGGTGLAIALLGLAGCDPFFNQTASLGGDTAGETGTIKTVFINNTAFRAVFTFGTYNQTDRNSVPRIGQYGLEDFEINLDAGESTDVLNTPCGRVFGVGSERLLEFVDNNRDDTEDLVQEALEPGVQLYELAEGSDPVLQGSATGTEYLLGTEFNCESLVVVRIEVNDAGGDAFRLDFEVVPAESTR